MFSFYRLFFVFTFLIFIKAPSALAVIDMKNSNYSDVWTDIIFPGSGFELRIQRTYNSRTLFNGIFGFGWCSDYETLLEVTAESQLRLTECGAGQEVEYQLKNFNPKKVHKTIEKIIAAVKARNPKMGRTKLLALKKDLKTNKPLRVALAKRLQLSGDVLEGRTYKANGRETEHIVFKNKEYTRFLADGTRQKYNLKGQLVSMFDKNGNYIKINYRNNKISHIQDNRGRRLSFFYYKNGLQKGRIKYISGPNNIKATYQFKGEDLVAIKNQWGSQFRYEYDNLHNLTKIIYPDKTYKALTYNKDKDLVTSFRHRNGCLETYKYKIDKKSKAGHYWSIVKKVCGKQVTNNSVYEFIYKYRRGTNEKYLARVNSKINSETSSVIYHPIFGRPLKSIKNGRVTTYTYYPNGLVKTKKEPTMEYVYSYDKVCNKISKLTTKFFVYKSIQKKRSSRPLQKRKLFKTVVSRFKYNHPKCHLVLAKSSNGQIAKLSYDRKGRIKKIVDQSNKVVKLKYDKKFGRPSYIQRPGLGSIKISYDKNGEIKSVNSKDGSIVATKIATDFNILLEFISPATSELTL